VLLIDDDVAIHRIFERLLGDRVYLLAVTRASEALARIASGNRYDAVVCDVQIPGLTGAEFMRELCRLDAAQAARVLFISGGVLDKATLAFLRSLPNQLIAKPFTIAELRAAVHSACTRHAWAA
jgi:CheY-like chemotaxis protein